VGGKSGVNYLVLQVHYGKVDNFVGKLAGLHVLPSIEPCRMALLIIKQEDLLDLITAL